MSIFRVFSQNKNNLSEKVAKIFADPPTLQTERLILRKIVKEDAEDMYEYSRDPDVTRYLTWSPHTSLRQTERYIDILQKKYADGSFNDWGLVLRETGKFIGTCGYTSFDYGKNTAEVGYVLSKDCWGNGLAAEAAKRVMEFGFETFELDGYFAKHMEGNDASARVMQKCGMKFEGLHRHSMYIKGEFKNIVVYEVTREEYFEAKNRQK